MSDAPVVVNGRGLLGAFILDGEYKGLPWALAAAIACGHITRAEVERRGWRYADSPSADLLVTEVRS